MLCGHEVSDKDTVCPGCDNDIDYLIEKGYIEGKKKKVSKDYVVDNSILKDGETFKEEVESIPEVSSIQNDDIKKEDISFDDVHTVLASREPKVIEDNYEETETLEENIENVVEEKPKKKSKKGLIAFILILLFVLVISGMYFFLVYFNPAKIMANAVKNVLPKLDTKIDGNMEIDSTLVFEFDKEKEVNNSTINLVTTLNKNMDAHSNIYVYDVEGLVSTSEMIKKDNEVFIKNIDLYDEFFKVPFEELPSTTYYKILSFIRNTDSFKTIGDELYNILIDKSFKSNYDKDYVKKENSQTKVMFKIDLSVINKIRENVKLFEAICSVLDYDGSELIKELNDSRISLYTDFLSNKYYGIEFSIGNKTIIFNLENNDIKNIEVVTPDKKVTISKDYVNITLTDDNMEVKYINRISSVDNIELTIDEFDLYDEVKEDILDNLSDSKINTLYNWTIKKTFELES